jgi:hypothetical protein
MFMERGLEWWSCVVVVGRRMGGRRMMDQMVDVEPEGFSAISRWLSVATPPDEIRATSAT